VPTSGARDFSYLGDRERGRVRTLGYSWFNQFTPASGPPTPPREALASARIQIVARVEAFYDQLETFTKFDSKLVKLDHSHVLLGEPLQHSAAYERLVFYVDARICEVRRATIIDARGNRNHFDFVHGKVNPPLPPCARDWVDGHASQLIPSQPSASRCECNSNVVARMNGAKLLAQDRPMNN
jgi:hypothetical protein